MSEPRLLEIVPVRDTFVSNIGAIEVLNSCARFVLYVDRDGHREVVAKIVMPIENVPGAISFTIKQLGRQWLQSPDASLLFPLH